MALAGLFEIVGDGAFPRSGTEGADVLFLGQLEGLDERLAEKAESGSGLRFDVALGDGGEKAAQREAQVAGGHIVAREKKGDIFASFLASAGLRFLTGVEDAEMRMAVTARA